MSKIVEYRIVIGQRAGATEKRAAAFLQQQMKLICGQKLPLVTDALPPQELEILVGQTNREQLDQVDFGRSGEKRWEYVLIMVGKRFYITGLGVSPAPAPYLSAYADYDDGHAGTAHGVYAFVEKVLGYNFMFAAYGDFTEKPELEMPEHFELFHTSQHLKTQLPEKMEGAALYVIPRSGQLDWQMTCMIIKTASDKLIVVDGGRHAEAERVLGILEYLSGGKKPIVSAWLFSHMHDDHFQVYADICRNPELASRVTVEHFYCHLLSEEFYTTTAAEIVPDHGAIRTLLLGSEQTLGAKVHTVQRGDVIRVDEIAFEVLHIPVEEHPERMNMNDTSVVYKMNYDNKQTMMLLGDAEYICSNDLVASVPEKLKCDVVQVGHHGCGNVSEECYRLMNAKYYIWQISPRFWYSDGGNGLGSRSTGVERTIMYIGEAGGKPEYQFRDSEGILSFSLPIAR